MKRKGDDLLSLIATSYKRQRCDWKDTIKFGNSLQAAESALGDVKKERDAALSQLQTAKSDCVIMNKKNSEQTAEIAALSVKVQKLEAENLVISRENTSINLAMNDHQSQVLRIKSSLLSVFKSFDEPTNGDGKVQ